MLCTPGMPGSPASGHESPQSPGLLCPCSGLRQADNSQSAAAATLVLHVRQGPMQTVPSKCLGIAQIEHFGLYQLDLAVGTCRCGAVLNTLDI